LRILQNQQNSDTEEDEEENQEVRAINRKEETREKPVMPRTPSKQKELTLSLSQIPEGVKVVGDMLGCVNKLKYVDHDVADMGKFPEFVQQVYMESKGEGPSGDPILEPKQWIAGLYNTRIMNLLEIPHFGRGKYVNACVKQLLALVHGGILWMDRHVSIDVDLIAEITGLPTDGEKPEQYMDDKTKKNPWQMR
jgi:hypothetical protein